MTDPIEVYRSVQKCTVCGVDTGASRTDRPDSAITEDDWADPICRQERLTSQHIHYRFAGKFTASQYAEGGVF